MAGQQAHHGQPSLRPHSLLQACKTPRRTSGSVKAHHPRSADQSAISKPTVTLTRNVSSPVAAMSLRRWLLALTPPSAPMLCPHRTGRSKSSVFRDPFNSPKLQARSLRIDLRLCAAHRRLRPRGPGPAFLMGRKTRNAMFPTSVAPAAPAETFRHGNMESH